MDRDRGPTRSQLTAIRPPTPRNCGVGTPSCDPAPQTTSFGTVGQWERRQQAMVPSTRASTLGPGVAGWALLRCDLEPQSTSFGTMALRERQHLAMTPSTLSSTHSNASLLVLLARAFGLSSSMDTTSSMLPFPRMSFSFTPKQLLLRVGLHHLFQLG